ncbi:amidohydrolase [Corynebacterium pygosceleis]|uniref:amidohydrolase n=1 Tax=Corynebacterium pygosceleis TaxID=2800406 RepID=UPI0019074866|nr:amidohydrolase [Corynebacterium pygosceleis]MCK7674190.1 amidohydrolase [Corynebacterium pygosceleis]MCL0120508.1 amidohydrolase [Corynebacterium pygosceleis]
MAENTENDFPTTTAAPASVAALLEAHRSDLSWQRDFYREMHAHPELSGHEKETAERIAAQLTRFDAQVTTHIGGYGIVAVFTNGEGPCVLMRADFDGLPVKEETGVDFASTDIHTQDNGYVSPVMHACGHDMHTTALLGACQIMDEHRDAWRGTFIALFQPAEENSDGAIAMVNDGLMEVIPRPQVCLGQHIVPGPAGTVMSMPGAALAACDTITVTIHGRSAHGSMPHNSIDPTFIAAMVVVRLQGIVGREVSPEDFAVVTVGTLSAGHTNNTIPGTATLVLNCRFYDNDVKDRVYRAIERVVRAECAASGCEREPDFVYSAHGELTDNDPGVFRRVRATFDAVFGEDSVDARRWTASEDFCDIPNAFGVPYLFWTVGVTPREQWAAAAAAGRISRDIPTNHSGTFLPDYAPSVDASTRAATAAVLSYLGR